MDFWKKERNRVIIKVTQLIKYFILFPTFGVDIPGHQSCSQNFSLCRNL